MSNNNVIAKLNRSSFNSGLAKSGETDDQRAAGKATANALKDVDLYVELPQSIILAVGPHRSHTVSAGLTQSTTRVDLFGSVTDAQWEQIAAILES